MPDSPGKQFGHEIEPYLDRLFRAAFRLTGNTADAQDLVQDTCVRVFRNIEIFKQSESRIAWLMRVQYNVFIDSVRRKRRLPMQPIDDREGQAATAVDSSADPAASAARTEWMDQMYEAFGKLNADQRALLVLRAEGYSLTEMSEITGLKVNVINARLHRTRRTLARHMEEITGPVTSPKRMEGR